MSRPINKAEPEFLPPKNTESDPKTSGFWEILVIVFIIFSLMKIISMLEIYFQHWLAYPVILVAGAIIPTIAKGRPIRDLGVNFHKPLYSIGLTIIISLPIFAILLLVQRQTGLISSLPNVPRVAEEQLPAWILYQFLYISVSEELFFRGYLLSKLLKTTHKMHENHPKIWQALSIFCSSVVFALAHFIILGGPSSLLTFFPGLIMGWLFVKTRNLMAPVVFHGLANIFYAILPVIGT